MIIPTLERGGAEKQLFMLARGLDRARFSPLVVALTRGGPYEDDLRDAGVPCAVIGKNRRFSVSALLRLRRLLARERPDVVHTWMFAANAVGRVAARLAGRPRVVIGERCVDKWKGRGRLALDRALVRWTDAVAANSGSVADWLARVGVPRDMVRVIPNAFDPAGCPARPLDELGGFGDAPRVTSMGRLWPQKRFDVVLRAMRGIVDAFPAATLTIAGEGPLRAELEALAGRLGLGGAAKMPGRVADAPALLRGSDLFLFASDWEGMPNAVMEAMYVGVPVVAAAAPGVVDLVKDGVNGVLAPLGDGAAMAAAAVALLRDTERMQSLAQRARRDIVEGYSVAAMVQAYEGLYERVAAGREGAR